MIAQVTNDLLALDPGPDEGAWRMWLVDETELVSTWRSHDGPAWTEYELRRHPDTGLEYFCVCEVGGGFHVAFLLNAEKA